jgi:competence protein ComEC
VLGIAMLYKPIYSALRKIKIHNAIAASLSVSMSTTISLIMLMSFYFKSLSIISILANVILIPLFTIAFVPTFIIAMFSVIVPYVAYLLFPINYLFDFIVFVANIFANTPLSNITTIGINYIAIIVYFVLLVLIGKLCSAKGQYKFAISLPTLALLLYCLL